MSDAIVSAGGVATLFGLLGILIKMLFKTDDRWVKIVDSKDEIIVNLTVDRDYWRDACVNCWKGNDNDRRHEDK